MELKDFEKLEFVFENVTSMTVRKEDVNFVRVNDRPNMIDNTPLRRVRISIKTNARPLEMNPELSFVDMDNPKSNNISKRVINHFEYHRGYGDITDVVLYKTDGVRQYLCPYWSEIDSSGLNEFNLYQYSGYETDENFEFTGNYEIEFFVAAKKGYECVDEHSRYIGCCSGKDETGLPYNLLFLANNRGVSFNSRVLIDTEDQYVPIAVDESGEVYIKNVWLDDLRPYDKQKVRQCMDFIQEHSSDIRDHHFGYISDSTLVNRLHVVSEE